MVIAEDMSKRKSDEHKPLEKDNPSDTTHRRASVVDLRDNPKDAAPVVIRAPPSKVVMFAPDDDEAMATAGHVPPETPDKFEQKLHDSRGSLQAHRFVNDEQFQLFTMLPMSDAAKRAFLMKQARAPGKPGGPLWKDTREAVRT
jgi:hypothetical protein